MDESHKQEENLKKKTKQEKLRVVYIRSGQQNREAQLEAAVLIAVQYYYKRDTDAHTHTHTHGCTYSTPSSNKPLAGAQWAQGLFGKVEQPWKVYFAYYTTISPQTPALFCHRGRLANTRMHGHTHTHTHASAHMLPCTADNEDRIRHLKINMKCPEWPLLTHTFHWLRRYTHARAHTHTHTHIARIFSSPLTSADSTLCSPSTVKRGPVIMKPEWSVRTELQLEHCQSPITVCVCVCVCVCVFVVGRTGGNNKCVCVQPARVMDKYTFNNSPMSQYRDRPAAVEVAEGSRMDQRPSDHDRTHTDTEESWIFKNNILSGFIQDHSFSKLRRYYWSGHFFILSLRLPQPYEVRKKKTQRYKRSWESHALIWKAMN